MFCQPRSVTPIHPRASFYKGDGSGALILLFPSFLSQIGRDLYILKDSGGLIKGGFRPMAGKSVKLYSKELFLGSTGRAASNNRGGYSRLDGKPLHYHSDGTGRDNYIV